MGLSTDEKLLLQKVRRFGELEKEFLKYNYETPKPVTTEESLSFMKKAIQIAWDAFTIRSEILYEISELREVTIYDKNALRLLDGIRNGDPFYSISFHEKLFSESEDVPTSMDDFLMQKFDNLFEEFHSWFDLIGYFVSKTRIGPIISASKIPKGAIHFTLPTTTSCGRCVSKVLLSARMITGQPARPAGKGGKKAAHALSNCAD